MSLLLPSYDGPCLFAEGPDATIGTDGYGLDTLQRTFIGRKDQFADEIAKFHAGDPDYLLPTMTFTNATGSRTDRSWGYIVANYSGKLDGSEPQENIVDDWGEATIDLNTGETTLVQPASIDYRMPVTTFKYSTLTRPTGPRHSGPGYGSLGIDIVGKRGIAQIATLSELKVRQKAFLVPPFKREQVGLWWQCTEQWEIRLVQIFMLKQSAFGITIE